MASSSKAQRVVVQCPGCRKESKCRREFLGKALRCKECSTIFHGHEPEPASEATPSGPSKGQNPQRAALDCPGCGRRLSFRMQYLGQVVACKHCDCTFVARGERTIAGGPPSAPPDEDLFDLHRAGGEHPTAGLDDESPRQGESLTIAIRDLEFRLDQVRARQQSEKRHRIELDEARAQLSTLRAQVAELEAGALRAQSLEDELARARAQAAGLEEASLKARSLEDELAKAREQAAGLEAAALKARSLEEELGQAREQLERSRDDLAGSQERRRRDEEKLAGLEAQIREATAREAALLVEFREARDELAQQRDADERLARLGEELGSLRAEEARWAEARLEWEGERGRWEEARLEWDGERSRWEGEQGRWDAERGGAASRLEEARLLAESWAEERAAWDRERGEILARAEARPDDTQAVADAQAECLNLRGELDRERARASEAADLLRQELEARRLEIERLGLDLERARADAASLASERDELLGRAESRDAEGQGWEVRLASVEAEHAARADAHRREASALEDQVAAARRAEAEARTRADELGRLNDELRAEAGRLEAREDDRLATAIRGEAESRAQAAELERLNGELRVALERRETRAEEESIAHRRALADWEGRLEAGRRELEAALAEERRRHESEIRLRDAELVEARRELARRAEPQPSCVVEPVPAREVDEPTRAPAPGSPEGAREHRLVVEATAPAPLPIDEVLDDLAAVEEPGNISVQLTRLDDPAPGAEGAARPDPADSGERLVGPDPVANPARGESRRWLPRIGFGRRLPTGPAGPAEPTPQSGSAEVAAVKRRDDRSTRSAIEEELDQLHATLDNLYEQGRLEEATELARRLLEMVRDRSGEGGRLYAVVMNKLGTLLYRRGDHDEAGALFTRSEAILTEAGEARSPLFIAFLGNRAMLLRDQGDLAGARRVLDEAKVLGEEILEDSHPLREMIRYVRMMIGQGVPTQQLYSGVAVATAGL